MCTSPFVISADYYGLMILLTTALNDLNDLNSLDDLASLTNYWSDLSGWYEWSEQSGWSY